AYWAVGMVLAVGLGFGADLGGRGVWLGLAAGLAVAAGLMIGRFYLLQSRARGRTRRLAASGGLA
ncbi:MAG: MATE family efflux transporter, partial [Geminicoccales bacterium]